LSSQLACTFSAHPFDLKILFPISMRAAAFHMYGHCILLKPVAQDKTVSKYLLTEYRKRWLPSFYQSVIFHPLHF
jgi:hypothetical protein